MKLLSTTLLTLALAAGSAALACAQDQPAPPPQAQSQPQSQPQPQLKHQPDPQRETKMLSKRLNLTPDQAAKVEPILADREQRVQTLMSNTSLDQKSMRKQRRAIAQDTDAKLTAILTPDQQQQWTAMKEQRRQHGAGPQAQPAAATPPAL